MEANRLKRIHYYFRLGLTNNEMITALFELDNITLSKRHLKRLMGNEGLFRRKNHSDLLDVAMYMYNELGRSGKLHGYRWFHHKLRNNGYNIDRETVRNLLQLLDPEGEEFDNTVLQWNTHRISRSRLHPEPFGRPTMMYFAPRTYLTREFSNHVKLDELEVCREECRLKDDFPCSQEVFELYCVLMNEQNWLPPTSPQEAGSGSVSKGSYQKLAQGPLMTS
ncbi:hypothetical protein BSL78_22713 [Apostichopus japonicus]|uniref:Uncharacterized protein n=1 Tax=Stichopus japonicus TaxID=307972 RepID=A0A2G8JXI0_STIJA|nr:hypothetical protein BSL78_22713 [Apostichopus japonicus]